MFCRQLTTHACNYTFHTDIYHSTINDMTKGMCILTQTLIRIYNFYQILDLQVAGSLRRELQHLSLMALPPAPPLYEITTIYCPFTRDMVSFSPASIPASPIVGAVQPGGIGAHAFFASLYH